jgi:hypothetical protein
MSVVNVTSIVMGCVLFGVFHGLRDAERRDLVTQRLKEHGYEQFELTQPENQKGRGDNPPRRQSG